MHINPIQLENCIETVMVSILGVLSSSGLEGTWMHRSAYQPNHVKYPYMEFNIFSRNFAFNGSEMMQNVFNYKAEVINI